MPLAVLALALVSFQITQTAAGWCNASLAPTYSVTLTQLSQTEYRLCNSCDYLILNLPSTLNECDAYTWYLMSDLAKDPKNSQTLSQSREKLGISLDSTARYGVYCGDGCLSEYYCAAIAVAPVISSFTINTTEKSQECVLMQGDNLRLTCESEGFPITSSISIKHSDGQEICPSVNSSVNLTLVGTEYYGQLHHTCDVQDVRPGEQEFVCRVNFLPWGKALLESEAVEKAIRCKVIPVTETPSPTVTLPSSTITVPSSTSTFATATIAFLSPTPSRSSVLGASWLRVAIFISFAVLLF